MLTRFREELTANQLDTNFRPEAYEDAICTTLATSGSTILISGVILLAAFAFLGCFPVAIIASMGLGCSLTMVVLLLVNLTLPPALFGAFPGFFSKATHKTALPESFRFPGLARSNPAGEACAEELEQVPGL